MIRSLLPQNVIYSLLDRLPLPLSAQEIVDKIDLWHWVVVIAAVLLFLKGAADGFMALWRLLVKLYFRISGKPRPKTQMEKIVAALERIEEKLKNP